MLRTLVAIMRSGLRSYDPIVRMGGDGFACGIAGATLDEVDPLFYEVERSLHLDTGVGISVGMAALRRRRTQLRGD